MLRTTARRLLPTTTTLLSRLSRSAIQSRHINSFPSRELTRTASIALSRHISSASECSLFRQPEPEASLNRSQTTHYRTSTQNPNPNPNQKQNQNKKQIQNKNKKPNTKKPRGSNTYYDYDCDDDDIEDILFDIVFDDPNQPGAKSKSSGDVIGGGDGTGGLGSGREAPTTASTLKDSEESHSTFKFFEGWDSGSDGGGGGGEGGDGGGD